MSAAFVCCATASPAQIEKAKPVCAILIQGTLEKPAIQNRTQKLQCVQCKSHNLHIVAMYLAIHPD